MKKTFIYILALLVVGLTSCDEDFNKDMAPPQGYDQEDAKSVDGYTIALGDAFTSPIILTQDDITNEVAYEIVKATATLQMEEGAYISFKVEISKTEDFAESTVLPVERVDEKTQISAQDLDEAIKTMYGKAPNPRSAYLRVHFYIVEGTSAIMNPTPVVLGPVTITPVAQVIESMYYLIGDMNNWNVDALIAFNHSGGNVYDDPIFSVILEVSANTYFKIAPQSAKDLHDSGGDFWSIVYGTAIDGDPSLEGTIVTENAQAIKIENAGYVRITLNMEEYSYTIQPMEVNPLLYIPGNHQGWDPASAPTLYTENMDLVYDGFVYLDGEYKFTSAPNWDNTNYGNGGDGKLSTDGGAGNLNAPAGFYYLKADLNTLTYQQTLTEWGIIGDATAGAWDSSTPMTYNRNANTWTVTTALEGGKDFKFRANDAWDINLGGSAGKLTFGGDNIRVNESGTYTIVLKITNALDGYTYTINK